MTNPMFNPQPNYSGVTIQISNPAVNVGSCGDRMKSCVNSGYCNVNPDYLPNYQGNNYITYPNASYQLSANPQPNDFQNLSLQQKAMYGQNKDVPVQQNTGYPNAYPAQYYLNNYNYAVNGDGNNVSDAVKQQEMMQSAEGENGITPGGLNSQPNQYSNGVNSYKIYAQGNETNNSDMNRSENIKADLAEREAEIQEEKKNTKEAKIVALTDEYIKSLENYLNNPNDEIRLMASKEILTRLDEDKDRYDDAALNALLNKMMQDPNKLVRIAALSAFSAQLASGNDYTVQLLQNIQSNPNSDKEDVLQAADILLKMSAGVEVKNIPNPSVKENKE